MTKQNMITQLVMILGLFSLGATQDLRKTTFRHESKESIKMKSFQANAWDASIYVQRYSHFNDSISLHESISVGFSNNNLSHPNQITVNQYVLDTTNHFGIQLIEQANLSTNLYGQNIKIAFNNIEATEELYCSNPIFVSFDVSNHPNTISEGMHFNWTPDPNSEGVEIYLYYSNVSTVKSINKVEKRIFVEDNGDFSIPKNWLSDVAIGSYVTFKIRRHNYRMINKIGQQQIRFWGTSECSTTLEVR